MTSFWHFEPGLNGVFVTLDHGTRVYFPQFGFSKGFVIESITQETQIREGLSKFGRRTGPWILIGVGMLILAAAIDLVYRLELWPYLAALSVVAIGSYLLAFQLFLKRITRGLVRTRMRPPTMRKLEIRSRRTPMFLALMLPVLGACTLGLGLLAIVGTKHVAAGAVIAGVGVAAICVGLSVYALKKRDEAQGRSAKLQ